MRLEQYLDQRGESQNGFAKRSGVPQSIVNRICLGGDAYGRNWALIQLATRGRVSPSKHFGAGA